MGRDRYREQSPDRVRDDLAALPRLPVNLFGTARIQADRRNHDRDDANRRQSERAEVDARASLSISLQHGIEGNLDNLSAHGCSMKLPEGSFGVGDSVWFRIESIQPWKGTIRWVSRDKVGMEFEHPFYRSVFELLVQSNKPVRISKAA